jgi:phosphohistidine swiveling domain-containing protein
LANFTTPLDTKDDGLERVGGKGRSLAKLTNAGFQVPGGFQVTTTAYRGYVKDNGLQERILKLAQPAVVSGRASFQQASEDVQGLFDNTLSPELIKEITAAYQALKGQPAVAVRSSANAEDLPGLSFAGQQETFLNVRGTDAVVTAVKKCWASLWTAQAISYRHQNGIDQNSVAMAVVVQIMVPSEVSGILFTANPATGERNEIIINASFGLGEAVVSGQVTPDTYIVDKSTRAVKETVIGPKAQKITSNGDAGTKLEDVSESERGLSSLSASMLTELTDTALRIETLFGGLAQDIEWAFCDGKLHLLQSRPITNLPVQPIEIEWVPTPPAQFISRRQIVENMPDPLCPLFEELYLTEGLESPRNGRSLMVGGGPMFVTMNGYAYMRFDFPAILDKFKSTSKPKPVSEADIEAEEMKAEEKARLLKEAQSKKAAAAPKGKDMRGENAERDLGKFADDLSAAERKAFDTWKAEQDQAGLALKIAFPVSKNPTYSANNNTAHNDKQLGEWHDITRVRLMGIKDKWSKVDVAKAADTELLEAIREMGIEEGYYWSSNASHTFGVAKSTDDHLQCFLHETLPDHQFISGQFLSGIESKTMQANADLFKIAKLVRASPELSYTVIVTPGKFLMAKLRAAPSAKAVVSAIDQYLTTYGHQGYSMDFVEPTQVEDPSGLLATLRGMVTNKDYDPRQQDERAAKVRDDKYAEISKLLSGLAYWQFRFRLWLARKYNYIREEVAFLFGYNWSVLRPMGFELGRRLVAAGTLQSAGDVFYLVTAELQGAIEARKAGTGKPELGVLAAARRELREARKRHHPPGTVPEEARSDPNVSFKETQILNDESSNQMRGFAVSSGRVTAKASVILGPADFDKMETGSILVSPMTTPAWTQLFAGAVGLVTDMGSILAHGSIVAREYGIPAVLGVGNGTKRIRHGQMLTIDGDAGIVIIHEDETAAAS